MDWFLDPADREAVRRLRRKFAACPRRLGKPELRSFDSVGLEAPFGLRAVIAAGAAGGS